MVGTKITCQRDGWHKNNSSKGWTDAELNGRLENNSQKKWTGGESQIVSSKITRQMDGQMES